MARRPGSLARAARTLMLDSPISRVGFGFATAVGLLWGVPLSVGRIKRHGELIICTGLPKWAFRRGGVCVGRVYITNQNVHPRVLKHELVHVDQWRRYGMLFPILYGIAGNNPLTNRFEIEAGLEDGGYVRNTGGTRPSQPSSRSS